MILLLLPYIVVLALGCVGGWLIVRGVRTHAADTVRLGILFLLPLVTGLLLLLFIYSRVLLTGDLMQP